METHFEVLPWEAEIPMTRREKEEAARILGEAHDRGEIDLDDFTDGPEIEPIRRVGSKAWKVHLDHFFAGMGTTPEQHWERMGFDWKNEIEWEE